VSDNWFHARSLELIVRRALLVLRIPPAALNFGPRRWTEFVSRLAYWRSVRQRVGKAEWQRLTRGVPVLLYHAFGDDTNDFVVSRRGFALQMRMLSLLGFRVVPYGELVRILSESRVPPRRTVVLTIDDGYLDSATIAVDVLGPHGFGATIFLVSGFLGGVNGWSDDPLGGRGLLAVEDMLALRARGIEFGAHTRTHPRLPDLADDAIADEVQSSRDELERALGEPVRTFAYPYGLVDERAVAAVGRAGFVGACTTEPRPAQLDDDPLLIPRIGIMRSDSPMRFLLKVWFGGPL
jgi:peptidoglycan/xylan/chitin deacetylase (PgdA/CDA1 family)